MSAANNSNESYCTFTLASDVTAGGLPSEEEIAKQLESNDPKLPSHKNMLMRHVSSDLMIFYGNGGWLALLTANN
eukprot:scaffold1843_cov107-Skeletonema_dohrnii-CCMP3373.AAC.4